MIVIVIVAEINWGLRGRGRRRGSGRNEKRRRKERKKRSEGGGEEEMLDKTSLKSSPSPFLMWVI